MDEDYMDDALEPGTSGTPSSRHALLVAALLHLMSQYALRSAASRTGSAGDNDGPCVKLAAVIERHLEALHRLPDVEPVLRATCEQLGARWADMVAASLPRPAPRRALLARLLAPQRKADAGALVA